MLFGVDGVGASVLGWYLPSYLALMGVSFLLSVVLTGWQVQRVGWRWAIVVDCALAGLALGLILARAEHVALHWNYFSTATGEITDLRAGGLGWGGALVGGIAGVWLMAKLCGRDPRALLDAAALAVPVLMFGGWWACEANACAYGTEVANLADYAPIWVWESPGDYGMLAPRWRTQGMGMAASVVIFAVVALMVWRGWARGWRLTWAVGLTILAMSAIGFLRGDLP